MINFILLGVISVKHGPLSTRVTLLEFPDVMTVNIYDFHFILMFNKKSAVTLRKFYGFNPCRADDSGNSVHIWKY